MATEYLIVGAGFAGAVSARQLADAGHRVLLVDRRNHIGGNAYDRHNDDGVLCGQYGPHIFHTNARRIVDYLGQFTEWRPYTHRVRALVESQYVPVPINLDTIEALGSLDVAIRRLYRDYSRKQWGLELEALDPSVLARVMVRDTRDDRYFTDTYQLMPAQGYTRLFERLLDHANIHLLLQADARDVLARGWLGPILWTGPIDEWFAYALGPLPYRSARFEWVRSGVGLPAPVVNVPDPQRAYTRMADMRQITGQDHPLTAIAFEYPQAVGEPFWPVPTPDNLALAARYRQWAASVPDVYFLGRLGSYQYLDMHQAVAQALTVTSRLLGEARAA